MDFPTPSSITVDGDSMVALIQIEEAQEFFSGHFVGAPVLAGVVQIGMVIGLMEMHLGCSLIFKGFKSVKFTHLVQPPAEIKLNLNFNREKNLIKYQINLKGKKCSSGNILVKIGEGKP